ncbi:MAG: hypothetical protein ACLRPW_03780 [Intestinibacter sp.]
MMDIILNSNSEFNQIYWKKKMTWLANKANVLAVAYKKISKDINEIEHNLLEKDLQLVGLGWDYGSPKEEVIDAILQAEMQV